MDFVFSAATKARLAARWTLLSGAALSALFSALLWCGMAGQPHAPHAVAVLYTALALVAGAEWWAMFSLERTHERILAKHQLRIPLPVAPKSAVPKKTAARVAGRSQMIPRAVSAAPQLTPLPTA